VRQWCLRANRRQLGFKNFKTRRIKGIAGIAHVKVDSALLFSTLRTLRGSALEHSDERRTFASLIRFVEPA